MGSTPETIPLVRKLGWMIFHVVWERGHKFLSFCHNACVWQTDARTDGQKGLDNTVRCITCSRTVKCAGIHHNNAISGKKIGFSSGRGLEHLLGSIQLALKSESETTPVVVVDSSGLDHARRDVTICNLRWSHQPPRAGMLGLLTCDNNIANNL